MIKSKFNFPMNMIKTKLMLKINRILKALDYSLIKLMKFNSNNRNKMTFNKIPNK